MLFNPSTADVRRFFCETWRKHCAGELLTPLEATALKWIEVHPEYHTLLEDVAAAVTRDFSIEQGQTNPFLHLSMHLAIDEQTAIDQPAGFRALLERLAARAGTSHAAAHQAMECLGQIMWEAQRGTLASDMDTINAALLECLRRRLNN